MCGKGKRAMGRKRPIFSGAYNPSFYETGEVEMTPPAFFHPNYNLLVVIYSFNTYTKMSNCIFKLHLTSVLKYGSTEV